MRLVFDQPRAKHLPSRRRFALARLIALATFRLRTDTTTAERVVYAIDADHDTAENHFVSAWFTVMTFAYAVALVPLRGYAAVLLALVLTPIVLHVPLFTAAFLTGLSDRDLRRYQSIFHFTVILSLSVYVARLDTPPRYVAWFSLALCAANAVAAVVMLFARGTVARMEAECGI